MSFIILSTRTGYFKVRGKKDNIDKTVNNGVGGYACMLFFLIYVILMCYFVCYSC